MDQAPSVLRLTAFSDDPAGGNPAGVVLTEVLPTATDMQRLATEVGYSETAFVAPLDAGRHTVRYFSPQAEVDFCGHATIAAGVVLGQRSGDGRYVLETNVGRVPLRVRTDDTGRTVASLTTVAPRHREVQPDALAAALATFGWTAEVLDGGIPPVEAFAGAWHLVLAVASRATLAGMRYRFDDLRTLMLDRGLTTLQVVWRQDPTTFVARNPFPVGGVVEDPATGAAAGALAGYLRAADLIDPPVDLTINQGLELGRPSRILVHVPRSGGIEISGTAVADPV